MKEPAVYACSVKCIDEAKAKEDAEACVSACSPTKSATTGGTAVARGPAADTEVDSLTSSTVKSRIRKFSSKAKTIGETSNSAGWSASVVVPDAYLDAYVYKVILADTKSHADGLSMVTLLKKSSEGYVETKVGNSRVLFVDCTRMSKSGSKSECSFLDSHMFVEELKNSRELLGPRSTAASGLQT